jgi:hypothetical protein
MFRWLMEHGPRGGTNEMPDNFPVPEGNGVPGSLTEFIEMVAIAAVASHLLHELAHFLNPEEDFNTKPDMESACDIQAATWLLSGQDFDFEEGLVQLIGTATALLLFSGETVEKKIKPGTTHPRCYDRLLAVLQHVDNGQIDVAWGYVAAMLAMHLDFAEINVPPQPVDSNFRQMVEAQIEAIHQHLDSAEAE